jgi:hypothetical protein
MTALRYVGNVEAILDYGLGRPWLSERVPGVDAAPDPATARRRAAWRRGQRLAPVEHPRLP